MRKIFSVVYKAYFFLLFAITLLLFYPVFYFLLVPKKKRFLTAFKVKRIWAFILFYGSFNRLKKVGVRKLKTSEPLIICPNHSSYMDIIVSYLVYPKPFLFLGKAELLKWPLFNIFFRHMDIAVHRQDPIKAARSMVRCRQALKQGYSLIIFPEGTISKEAPALRNFKTGAFKLACDTGNSILPVSYIGNHKVINVTSPTAISRPGLVKVLFHPPVDIISREKEQVPLLSKKVKEIIQQGIEHGG